MVNKVILMIAVQCIFCMGYVKAEGAVNRARVIATSVTYDNGEQTQDDFQAGLTKNIGALLMHQSVVDSLVRALHRQQRPVEAMQLQNTFQTYQAVYVRVEANMLFALPVNRVGNSHAEPATIESMSAVLEIPQGEKLTVDVFKQCFCHQVPAIGGILFNDTIVSLYQLGASEQFSPAYAEKIQHAWTNKTSPNDARLPTYLAVMAPPANTAQRQFHLNALPEPIIVTGCGRYDHPEVYQQLLDSM